MKPKRYECNCGETHLETRKPNQMPLVEGRCSANHRVPPNVGNWRVCHGDFKAFGGPNPIGSANLCDNCFKRIFAPAFAMAEAAEKHFHDLLGKGGQA